MCLAQGHNTVMGVRLEHAACRSRVEHSTTEPLLKKSEYDQEIPQSQTMAMKC